MKKFIIAFVRDEDVDDHRLGLYEVTAETPAIALAVFKAHETFASHFGLAVFESEPTIVACAYYDNRDEWRASNS
jgi:hypothetical protein